MHDAPDLTAGQVSPPSLLDHPCVGGRVTVFVLLYGDHVSLARRCIGSILKHSPPGRIELRVAANQIGQATFDYLSSLLCPSIRKIYFDWTDAEDLRARKKYPAMREMFWDADSPIETNYILWFDDDSHVVDPNWLELLAAQIIKHHPEGSRLYGSLCLHDLRIFKRPGLDPVQWFRKAAWWKERGLLSNGGREESIEGSQILFASGGFWALAAEVIRLADIPDRRLIHNGGDITIGAQVQQAGFTMTDFCRGKKPVCWSDAPPRGTSQVGSGKVFPWASPSPPA